MRPARVLEKMIVGGIRMSNGTMPIDLLAIDEEEAAWLRDHLRGRHGNRLVGIHRGTPADLASPFMQPWEDR